MSNFYASPLHLEGHLFKSAEHAYQHKKAVFHRQWGLATQIKSAKDAGYAKRLAKGIVETSTWQNSKIEIMRNILTAKAKQSHVFVKTLRLTSEKRLLHNVETDSFWGCGEDLRGSNNLGVLLEEIRRNLKFQLPPNKQNPTNRPKTQAKQTTTIPPSDRSNRVIVIGNSNARGMATQLRQRGLDATGVVYPGCSMSLITSRVPHTKPSQDPDHVVLMAGDIEAANGQSTEQICADLDNLVAQAKKSFPLSRILVSGLASTGNTKRQQSIKDFNMYVEEMQTDDRLVTYLNNEKA